MTSSHDTEYMRHALSLARRGLGRTWPNPSVGCVIVKNDIIVGRGWTADSGRPHAEVIALKQARSQAKGADVYVTLEPCAHQGQTGPCARALIDAGVGRVIVGCTDPDPRVNGKGIEMLQAKLPVTVNVLKEECRALNAGFFLRVSENRPYVTLKIATSADGKIAPEEGKRQKITGDLAHRHVHLERSRHDGILIGIGTVLADDPLLTTRLRGVEHKGVRVILDTHLRISEGSNLVKTAGQTPLWIVHARGDGVKAKKLEEAGVKLLAHSPSDVPGVLKSLAAEGLTQLLVEGGAQVHSSFLKAGMCDRFLHYQAPVIIGRSGLDALKGYSVEALEAEFGLKKQETRALEQDLLEIYTRKA